MVSVYPPKEVLILTQFKYGVNCFQNVLDPNRFHMLRVNRAGLPEGDTAVWRDTDGS